MNHIRITFSAYRAAFNAGSDVIQVKQNKTLNDLKINKNFNSTTVNVLLVKLSKISLVFSCGEPVIINTSNNASILINIKWVFLFYKRFFQENSDFNFKVGAWGASRKRVKNYLLLYKYFEFRFREFLHILQTLNY